MKISLRWLSRHVDLSDLTPQRILGDLTMSTAEIDGIHAFGAGLESLVVGHVLQKDRHPDADKLSVCRVDLGNGRIAQIVCGAPNVAAGQKVVVIEPGHSLPDVDGKGALKIKPAKIRGVDSHGMICSEREMGLSQDHGGILVLPDSAQPGARFVDVLPVQDTVFEIDNKSVNHRPDLWGHYGFARELAAIYGRPLRPLCEKVALPTSGESVAIHVEDQKACPRYCGLRIDGVTALPSPFELRMLLAAVGQRAINLPVDLTNFVMLDIGQPMHAFDASHVKGRSIRVRFAKPSEHITTLDEQKRVLEPTDLLVCAGDEPEALAGIMGGQGTMVGAERRRCSWSRPTSMRRRSVAAACGLGCAPTRARASRRRRIPPTPRSRCITSCVCCSSGARPRSRSVRCRIRSALPSRPSRSICARRASTRSLA